VVLIIDDMANDKADFAERAPTRAIIDICNNQPYYANMADLESKGKVFVEPAICMVTTNKKDLDAKVYSNCPYSIQRRMHTIITVKAKPEFQFLSDGKYQGIDSAKVAQHYAKTGEDPIFDDIWTLTLEKACQPDKMSHSAGWKVIEKEGKQYKDVSFREAIQYLINDFTEHLQAQEAIMERMRKRQKDIELCGEDGCRQIKGYCDKHPFTPHFGEEIADACSKSFEMVRRTITRDLFGLDRAFESACAGTILFAAKQFSKRWDWMTLLPTPWLQNEKVRNFFMLTNKDVLRRNYIRKTCFLWSGLSAIGMGALKTASYLPQNDMKYAFCAGVGSGLLAYGYTAQKLMVEKVKQDFSRDLRDRNTIAPMWQEFRDRHVAKICKACAIVGTLYTLAKVYKAWRSMRAQGSLEPTSDAR